MNDRPSADRKNGRGLFRESLGTFALMMAGIFFAVVIVRLALYYTVIKPFAAGFTDGAEWNRLLMVLFTVGFAAVSIIWLFVLYRKKGYKAGAFSLRASLLPCLIASVLHEAVAAVFSGHWVLSGAAYYAAWLMSSGGAPLAEGERVPLSMILLLLPAVNAFYSAVILLSARLGASARQKDRKEIIG